MEKRESQEVTLAELLLSAPKIEALGRRLAARVGLANQDFEDALQNARLEIVSNPPQNVQSPEGFFFTVLQRMIAKSARSHRAQRNRNKALMAQMDTTPLVASPPDEELLAGQTLQQLSGFIAALPAKRRRVAELHWIEGCSKQEIARVLGISIVTVNRQLGLALQAWTRVRSDER